MFSSLDNNKIKALRAQAFNHLKNLITVWLNGNECINENFDNPSAIATLMRVATKNCSFTEEFSKDFRNNLSKDMSTTEDLNSGKKDFFQIFSLIIFFRLDRNQMKSLGTGLTPQFFDMITASVVVIFLQDHLHTALLY